MLEERRQYARLTPTSPQLVLLDESKYSLLFDLCEGGLAIEGFAAQKPRDEFAIEFELPGNQGCIQTKAEVVWTSTSGYRTGFRFVELQSGYREQLRSWLAGANSSATSGEERGTQLNFALGDGAQGEIANAEAAQASQESEARNETGLFPVSFPISFPASPRVSQVPGMESNQVEGQYESFGESHLPAYAAVLVLAAAMCVLAFYMGYYWRGAHTEQAGVAAVPTVSATATPKIAPTALTVSAAAPKAALTTPVEPARPPEAPLPAEPTFTEQGFVLQVAAMKSEANADLLSTKLQNRKFSAFVFKRSSDHFHRVVVGPFRRENQALEAQRELKAEGFKSLVRPWSPE